MPDLRECRELAAGQPGCVLLEDCREPGRSLFFSEPVEWLEARSGDELPQLFTRVEAARKRGLWAAGFVGYECGRYWAAPAAVRLKSGPHADLPLAAFGLYAAPGRPSSQAGSPAEAARIEGALAAGPEGFARKVGAIHRLIERGDTYQVNLTDRFEAEFPGSAAALFARMMEAQPVAFGALFGVRGSTILSASPELFFRLRGREIAVQPMKGTCARGRDAREDAARMQWLRNDGKNRAENVMIVDLMRSDLGRIAEVGSVRVEELFAVERLPSLLQMTSTVRATLRPGVDLHGVFASLFPSGSIVGAPKVRTMEILSGLEERDRGPYTGAIGFASPAGEAVFSVAIRTAVLQGERLRMGVGAGITYDSDPAAEYAECLLKCEFLREAPFRLIETMRWERGGCSLLERHMERLRASAAYFGFRWDEARVRREIGAAASRLPDEGAWKLRLTLDRAGALLFARAEPVLDEGPGGVRALVWPATVHSGDRFLRHKTTRRALYEQAYGEVRARGYSDALFRNERGVVTEGAIHSIFARWGGRWRTPPLEAGVLPGVFRAHLLATMPQVEEAEFTVEELRAADEVWLTNAVRGVRVLARPGEQITAEPMLL